MSLASPRLHSFASQLTRSYPRRFTLITLTAPCLCQVEPTCIPSCVAVYPRNCRSRVFYVADPADGRSQRQLRKHSRASRLQCLRLTQPPLSSSVHVSKATYDVCTQLLFDHRENAFHLFFADMSQRCTLDVT